MNENIFFEEPAGEYKKEKDFTSLLCWQDARRLKLFFYKDVVPKLPAIEKYNLISQMTRAAVSTTANIAEGYGRFHYQEGIQFYRISRASIYELKDHLISCSDLEYINKELFNIGLGLIESTKIKINGYIKYVQKLKKDHNK